MKTRCLLLVALALSAGAVAPAHATGFTQGGTILLGTGEGTEFSASPLDREIRVPASVMRLREELRARGVSQAPRQCGTTNPLNGVDQAWYDVSAHRGHAASVVPTGANAFTADFDAWFFTSTCAFVGEYSMSQGATEQYLPPRDGPGQMGDREDGVVPVSATWMVVVLWSGAAASYTVSF